MPTKQELDALRSLLAEENQLGVLQWMQAHGDGLFEAIETARAQSAMQAGAVEAPSREKKTREA